MPQIPTYDGPQVREQALQPAFQQQQVDGGRNARAIAAGLGNLAEAVDQIDLRDAQAKAFDAEAKITADWLQWDKQARANFRGEKVDGYAPAAQEWWKNAADQYGKDLDPRARSLASRSLTAKQTSALGSVLQFSAAEKERHADEVANANIANTIQFGITTGDVAGAAQQLREMTAQIGARKGWTTEQLAVEQTNQLGKLHLSQIARLAETNANAAQTYYDEAKARGEIPYTAQQRVEEVIKGEADNQFATQFAAQNATLPLAEQLAKAGEITDPKRREKTLLQVRNSYVLVKEAQRAQEQQFSDQAWQLVGQGKRVPEAVLAGMDGRERVQLQEHLRARAERLAAGKPIKTDMPTYIDLREKLAAGEKVNLRSYTEKIAPAQMEQLLDIQTAVSKGGAKQDAMLTDEARLNNALVGLGIDKKRQPEQAAAFALEIDRRVRAESAAKGGKDLTPDEKQRVIDSTMMDKVFVDEWGRDPQLPLALVKPDALGNAYVNVQGQPIKLNSIPATDRMQIISALRKRNLPVTEQSIAELYMMNKKGK